MKDFEEEQIRFCITCGTEMYSEFADDICEHCQAEEDCRNRDGDWYERDLELD